MTGHHQASAQTPPDSHGQTQGAVVSQYKISDAVLVLHSGAEVYDLLTVNWHYADFQAKAWLETEDLIVTISRLPEAGTWACRLEVHDLAMPVLDAVNAGQRLLLPDLLAPFGIREKKPGCYALEAADAPALLEILNYLAEICIRRSQRQGGAALIHAASLGRDGRGLLLIGPGGGGKTTLAVGLAASGWTLLGDDASRVTRRAQLLPHPLKINLRRGGFARLVELFPDLFSRFQEDFAKAERIPISVRELFPKAPPETCRLGEIVFAEGYSGDGRPELRPIGRGEAAASLIPAIWYWDPDLAVRLDWAAVMASEAQCFAMRIGDLAETLRALERSWQW